MKPIDENLFIEEADHKIKQAEKLMVKKSWPISILSNYDPIQASDLFAEAGNLYQSLNMMQKAVYCFESAITCSLKVKDAASKSQAAQCYLKIAEIYSGKKFCDYQKSAEAYVNAAIFYDASGNPSLAASRRLSAAEAYINCNFLDEAEKCMEVSIELYDKANMTACVDVMMDKYIRVLVLNNRHSKLCDTFLSIAEKRTDWKMYMLLSGLCSFITHDHSSVTSIIETLGKSEEQEILSCLFEERKSEIFEEKMDKYLKIRSFKDEYNKILETVRSLILPQNDIL